MKTLMSNYPWIHPASLGVPQWPKAGLPCLLDPEPLGESSAMTYSCRAIGILESNGASLALLAIVLGNLGKQSPNANPNGRYLETRPPTLTGSNTKRPIPRVLFATCRDLQALEGNVCAVAWYFPAGRIP